MFLKTLAETCESAGWSVHSFVLMTNHYHLPIETHRPTLVKGMDRYLLAGLARQKTKVSVQWLATEFGLKTRGGMSYGIRQAKKRLKEDRTLRRRWNMLTHHETRTDP